MIKFFFLNYLIKIICFPHGKYVFWKKCILDNFHKKIKSLSLNGYEF